MPGVKNIPANRLNRQPRQFKQAAKPNAGAGQFIKLLGGGLASLAQTAAGIAGGPAAGGLVSQLLGGALGGGTLGGLGGGGLMGGTDTANQMALIQLQRQIQQQTQIFETLTNISKAEHDARMSSVRNIRP